MPTQSFVMACETSWEHQGLQQLLSDEVSLSFTRYFLQVLENIKIVALQTM